MEHAERVDLTTKALEGFPGTMADAAQVFFNAAFGAMVTAHGKVAALRFLAAFVRAEVDDLPPPEPRAKLRLVE